MHFIPTAYKINETVAAIATAPGEGGVAIIRISGSQAEAVAAKICSKDVSLFKSHHMYFCSVHSVLKEKLDECLVVIMRAPRSFTGEDTVEIHCHGGGMLTRRILQACLDAGARAAYPGEFSFKAFMNGKIDLAQAEAIQSLIGAKSESALVSAEQQLEGALSKKIIYFQNELTQMAAILEAWADFPEEDLEFAPFEEVAKKLIQIRGEILSLAASFEQGKVIHDGLHVAIVGSPNVGKSSIMNALLGKDRAIVSPVAGTTRDLIEEEMRLSGYHLRLIDTAGIRQTEELIEGEGIKRSQTAINRADVILFVLDVSRPDCQDTKKLIEELPKDKTIALWNKIDLPHKTPLLELPFATTIAISAFTSEGFTLLLQAIDQIVGIKPGRGEVVITALRHKEALIKAAEYIKKVIDDLASGNASAEFVTLDMRQSLKELGSIIGIDVTEDILTAIFSTFCIGK